MENGNKLKYYIQKMCEFYVQSLYDVKVPDDIDKEKLGIKDLIKLYDPTKFVMNTGALLSLIMVESQMDDIEEFGQLMIFMEEYFNVLENYPEVQEIIVDVVSQRMNDGVTDYNYL